MQNSTSPVVAMLSSATTIMVEYAITHCEITTISPCAMVV